LPEHDVENLRNDVQDPATVSLWIESVDYSRVLPLIACDELLQSIIAVSTLHFTRGVYRHIADVRIIVGKNYRKLGLGSAMIKELIELGSHLGLYFLRAEILSESRLPIKAFRQMGFEYKGTFEDGFMTRKGETRDLVLMFKRLRVSAEDEMFFEF
jgi:L-amino acid N-acyltransferase YncA